VLSPCEAFDTIAAATFDEKNTSVDSEKINGKWKGSGQLYPKDVIPE
jgi:hypothetical protein